MTRETKQINSDVIDLYELKVNIHWKNQQSGYFYAKLYLICKSLEGSNFFLF